MKLKSPTAGLAVAVLAALSFGTSGAFIKPLLEAGWSPSAAVTVRAFVGAAVLLPIAIVALRGRWRALWRARIRVLVLGVVGVAATQLTYFAAIQRIPVSTALLIELLAPLLLVAVVWVTSRRMPRPLVLVGSALAIGGLVLVIGPGAIRPVDPLGLVFACLALIACAIYFVVAARPSDGLPPVAYAAASLVVGGVVLALLGATGILPFTVTFGEVTLLGGQAPWWVPILVVGVISSAFAYVAGIAAAESLGSRLASFAGLLEVVFASLFAWILLGEALQPLQLLGGALILGGIAAVRLAAPEESPSIDEIPVVDEAENAELAGPMRR
ncbi:DMT family transporter [Amnibacterium flavum]|uniref:EamA family transporter n=1 Tax=Amnibacterium flavum TaxID=2173173 RepID=A0A2V1HWP7_9MICO|nr:EamA family transporter [Amnibacterium flavum]PVZ94644.1 EamA family transporter [Amnibacterium flavum]